MMAGPTLTPLLSALLAGHGSPLLVVRAVALLILLLALPSLPQQQPHHNTSQQEKLIEIVIDYDYI